MSTRKYSRIAALCALGTASALLAYLLLGDVEKNLVYYWDVPELLAHGDAGKGAVVRLGGLVRKGSVVWQPETLNLAFSMGNAAEGDVPHVRVQSHGTPPQMFQEGMGVVVEGSFNGEIFAASRVMVKHSNEYRAPVDGQRPQDLYKTLAKDQD